VTSPQSRTSPTETGYADVNGLHLYYEVYGGPVSPDGPRPLVLLHGGMLTIDLNWADLIPTLAADRPVVGVEMQGHGRTADIEREITPAVLASDVVALLDHLGVARADVMGHSLGAAVTLELAVHHGDRVGSVVPISGSVRPEGMHPDMSDPSTYATSTRMPTADDFAAFGEAYARLSPHPEKFQDFLTKVSASSGDLQGWSDEELAGITAKVLIVMGDHDFVTVAHGGLMLELIPGSRLAILPGTTHMQATRRTELLLPMLAGFLD
jgi:pimeloyl-ACP methyl ester carboxylesterase